MELVSIVLIASVVVLQIITVAFVLGIKKSLAKQPTQSRPAERPPSDRIRKDQDFRRSNNRKQFQETRQRNQSAPPAQSSQPSAPSIDPVEKSLRDINLRLKNAERDQESARRKIHDNADFNKEDRREERGPRSENSRGDSRNDGTRSRNNRPRNDRQGRDQGRSGNWSNNRQGAISQAPREEVSSQAPEAAIQPQQDSFPIEQSSHVIEQVAAEVLTKTSSVATDSFTPKDVGVNEENLQHGRKIMVKRRQLKEESGETAGDETRAISEESSSLETANVSTTDSDSTSKAQSTEAIRFGRR